MSHRDTRGIKRSKEQATLVEEAVEAGEFDSPEAVVAEALREWQQRRDNMGYTLDELRRLVREGIESVPALDGPTVLDRLRERYQKSV